MSSRFKAKTERAAVAVTVHRSATTDFTERKHDYDRESCTPELQPSVRVMHALSSDALGLKQSFNCRSESPPVHLYTRKFRRRREWKDHDHGMDGINSVVFFFFQYFYTTSMASWFSMTAIFFLTIRLCVV